MSGSIGDNPYRASGVVAAAAAGGGVSWQDVVTASTITVEAGNGYPINTTSNACTVTLPASASVGDEIILTDYARNFATNALTLNPNSLNYQGNSSPNPVYDTNGESIHIVYVDATQGWIPTYDGAVALETPQTFDVEYLIVAGGGGGGGGDVSYSGGGGGAGGYLTNYGGTAISFSGGITYTVTVGTGGAGGDEGTSSTVGVSGGNSSLTGSDITDITSAGGGGGGCQDSDPGVAGGSGGGGGGKNASGTGGAGDTPSTTPAQGFAGGYTTLNARVGGGGGGASEVGDNNTTPSAIPNTSTAAGGDGTANSITGSSVTYAGGGGSGSFNATSYGSAPPSGGAGGAGGGAAGAGGQTTGPNGTDGLGGGGGGGGGDSADASPNADGGDGGNGVVILRMPDADAAAGTKVNEDSTATDVGGSGETVITWLVDGSFTSG